MTVRDLINYAQDICSEWWYEVSVEDFENGSYPDIFNAFRKLELNLKRNEEMLNLDMEITRKANTKMNDALENLNVKWCKEDLEGALETEKRSGDG